MQNPALITTLRAAPVAAPGRPPGSRQPSGPRAPKPTTPIEATLVLPDRGPDCCVHILTKSLASISQQNPGRGKLDCPSNAKVHEQEVRVIAVQPDGDGGMKALIAALPGLAATLADVSRMQPVCTVGPQEREPVKCCIRPTPQGAIIECLDTNHELHGKGADAAVAAGYTLQACPAPADIPNCCVQLGEFVHDGKTLNGRLICDDESHPLHMRPVMVDDVSPDGAKARVGRMVLEICEIETPPPTEIEIECCIRGGRLFCPETPEFHGLSVAEFKKQYPRAVLEACPDVPPPVQPPPDCCVQLDEDGRAVMMSEDGECPWTGYELKPGEYKCVPEQGYCEVRPGGMRESFRVPLCGPPPPERVPDDCCFVPATGTLLCAGDPNSEWNGAKVSLIDLVVDGARIWAVVTHPKWQRQQRRIPVCEEGVPPECCFEAAADASHGATGSLICEGAPELTRKAMLVSKVPGPDGGTWALVSWDGGGARVPFCLIPAEETPEDPPPYMCCVNMETKTFVCPGEPERHGLVADVVETVEHRGLPWARLVNGQLVPICGERVPAPEPCPPDTPVPTDTPRPPQGSIPTQPEGDCPPPDRIPQDAPPVPVGTAPPMEEDCPPNTTVPQDAPPVPVGEAPPMDPDCVPNTRVPQDAPPVPVGEAPPMDPGCDPRTGVPLDQPPGPTGQTVQEQTCPPDGARNPMSIGRIVPNRVPRFR